MITTNAFSSNEKNVTTSLNAVHLHYGSHVLNASLWQLELVGCPRTTTKNPVKISEFLLILMEAFHILSRGGARFDMNRFKADFELFTVSLTFG